MEKYKAGDLDVAVIGAGHAGIEAALAAARMGLKTALFTLSLDLVGNMPCNPSIGGTGKGHLVYEITALGGEMGYAADKVMLQSRMLNLSKGPAVHSLRMQSDRRAYQGYMKSLLENTENLSLIQAEVVEVCAEEGKVTGVVTAPENRFFPYPEAQPGLPGFVPFTDTFHPYSGGMGAAGLPGDWSSSSRFVKAAYLRANTIPGGTKPLDAARFFHMLDAVAMPAGAVIVPYQGVDVPEITVYSCCMDLADGVYFYKTHENSRITAVDLYGGNLDETELAVYPMETRTDIRYVNRRREEDV